MPEERVTRTRLSGISPLARASKRSKPEDVEKIFKEVDKDEDGLLSLADLREYLGDYLGYGDAEILAFFSKYSDAGRGGVDMTGLTNGFPELNPYTIATRKKELLVRKPGAVSAQGAQIQLDELEDCTVLVCDRSEQAFVDSCKDCNVLMGPCNSSVFVRDCSNSTFWVATRQLRTRDCHNCTFFLYTFTEPIIESSTNLAFAPFCASYPGFSNHFEGAKFNAEKNLWRALFDFTGKPGVANWKILPLDECKELAVELPSEGVPAWDSPLPKVTHELLCAAAPISKEGVGTPVKKIPQTQPDQPSMPGKSSTAPQFRVSDAAGSSIEPVTTASRTTSAADASKTKLKKPCWTTVSKLKPDSTGVNIFTKVVKAPSSDDGEVVIGDATGVVTLRIREDQLADCHQGAKIRIQNAKVRALVRSQDAPMQIPM